MAALGQRVRLPSLDRSELATIAFAVNLELVAVGLYLLVANATITDPFVLVYPLVWVNVALLAVTLVDPTPVSGRQWYAAVAVGVAYFAVLLSVGGVVGFGGAGTGLSVHWLPPGYGPAVVYGGSLVTVILMPYKLVGYAALAYLVFVTVTDASASVLSGVVGLFSCVSCTWPVLAAVFTGVFGSASAAATMATTQAYGLSTVVFVVSVALLAWRPRA